MDRRSEAPWKPGGRWLWGGKFLALAVIAGPVQGGERPYCDPENVTDNCGATQCACSDDRFEIDFGEGRGSSFEYPVFRQGMRIDSSIVLRTETPIIHGWSFGIEHDPDFIHVLSASIEGTSAEIAGEGGFAAVRWKNNEIVRCPGSLADPCTEPVPASGIICVIILGLVSVRSLPPGSHEVLKTIYALDADPREDGTELRFTNRLTVRGSPPVFTSLTSGGTALLPRILVEGVIRGGGSPRFLRADVDATGIVELTDAVRMLGCLFLGTECASCLDAADVNDDGSMNIVDPIHLLHWLFQDGQPPPAPFPGCGLDLRVDAIPECIEPEMCQ